MTEERIGFLCNIASSLSPKNDSHRFLRSYYLMKCNELTRGYGLPVKHFSKEVRCPNCCLAWSRDTQVNVQPKQLNSQGNLQKNVEKSVSRTSSQRYNEMVQTCSFCKQSTKTLLVKPEKQYIKSKTKVINKKPVKVKENYINNTHKKADHKKVDKTDKNQTKDVKIKPKNENTNVYSNAFDVFSFKNEKNTLSYTIKEPAKVIKNNKKKKDKFSGLCQKAVLASAKLKQEKETQSQKTQNKLNLFLKPSS